jgi:(S)-sulfolactate dehydrogenase
MRKVIVPEYLLDGHVQRLRTRYEVVYDADLYADVDRLRGVCAGAEAIIVRNRTQIDEALLAAATDLRVVGRLGVGLDNIDTGACERAGVAVIPAIGGNAVSVAEYVMATMLILTRGVFGLTDSMVAGHWPRQGHAFGHELQGKTLGIVGLGSIGRHVATRAAAFGMHIIAHDPHLPSDDPAWGAATSQPLDDLLATADVISIHVPLVDSTRHLIGTAEFATMRPGAILINTARGGVIDEGALAEALRAGRLAGAALDVFATEPLGEAPASRFAGLDNLLLTPHIAGNTHDAVDRVATMTVDAVFEALDPAPPTTG